MRAARTIIRKMNASALEINHNTLIGNQMGNVKNFNSFNMAFYPIIAPIYEHFRHIQIANVQFFSYISNMVIHNTPSTPDYSLDNSYEYPRPQLRFIFSKISNHTNRYRPHRTRWR